MSIEAATPKELPSTGDGLLPCPFCGGNKLISGGDDKIVWVRCLDCDALGPNHYRTGRDWNIRDTAGMEAVRAAALEDAAKVAEGATLPENYQWGADAMRSFNFGKARAAAAIRALSRAPTGEKIGIEPQSRSGITPCASDVVAKSEAVSDDDYECDCCQRYSAGMHSCPYDYNGPIVCNCCDECTKECMDDFAEAEREANTPNAHANDQSVSGASKPACDCGSSFPDDTHTSNCASRRNPSHKDAHCPPAGDGWRLVPVEPTEEMAAAGLAELQEQLGHMAVIVRDPVFCYRAMLAAAPSQSPTKPAGDMQNLCEQLRLGHLGDAKISTELMLIAADTIEAMSATPPQPPTEPEGENTKDKELALERSKLANLVGSIVYGDSYGVEGSDFWACRLCNAGGAPNVPFIHDDCCPIKNLEADAERWWDERSEEAKGWEEDNEALRAEIRALKAEPAGEIGELREVVESAEVAAKLTLSLIGERLNCEPNALAICEAIGELRKALELTEVFLKPIADEVGIFDTLHQAPPDERMLMFASDSGGTFLGLSYGDLRRAAKVYAALTRSGNTEGK